MTNIRFAILGTAKIARTVAPKIKSAEGAELLGIASRNEESAQKFAQEFGIPRTYSSYAAALDDPDVDAVYVPLPPSLHQEWTEKAAAAGKHILCEKPLARNVDETDSMITVCQKHEVVLLDGVMWYHTARAAAIKRIVDSGQLGELRQLTSVFTFRWDTMPMENLRMHRDLGGGSLLDLGWYCVGASLWLLDEMPQQVYARANWCNDVDVRLNGFLWFGGENSAERKVVTIESGFDAVPRRWVEVVGATESLVCDDFTRPWNSERPRFWTHNGDGESIEHVVAGKTQEECMVEAFCELVCSGQTDHPWLRLSRKTQFVCDALDLSARSGKVVDVKDIDHHKEQS
jgi:predicted dehydrogenase